MILVLAIASMSSCHKKEEEPETPESAELRKQIESEKQRTDNDFDKPEYRNEEEGRKLVTIPHDEEDYVGIWDATSDYAQYLYGNVNIRINEDHTWSGNITGEDFRGKWRHNGSFVIIKDGDDIINWKLYFVTDGSLMFTNLDKPEIALTLMPAGGQNK